MRSLDDPDGNDTEGPVHFALDGTEYETDLNAGHAQALRNALARYVGAAWRAGGTPSGQPAADGGHQELG